MRTFLGGIAVAAMAFAMGSVSLPAQAQRYGGGTRDCGSSDNRYGECRVGWRDARLDRQESKAPCTRGRSPREGSWGFNNGTIWVDHGCRGIFSEAGGGWGGGRPDRPGGGWGGGGYREIDCGSRDNGRGFCPADTRGGVRLIRQNSDASCREGYSWGSTRDGIWVDRGCRGIFSVGGR